MKHQGRLAQLGEHLVYTQVVGGSIPSSPKALHDLMWSAFFYIILHIIQKEQSANLQNSTVFIQNSCYLSERIIKIDNTIL